MILELTTGARVVAAARGWIGTPFVHRASVKGVGCDCLGLVRGVWRELYGAEAEVLPGYGALWAEAGEGDLLREGLARHLREVPIGEAVAGDVLLFRFRMRAPGRHVAVVSAPDQIIHAFAGRGVRESTLGGWWLRRRVAAFRFP